MVCLGAPTSLLGACGPFTDVAADSFCAFVQEVFYLGVTTGTTATTYDPTTNVTRLQMAAFLSRTVDGVLKRNSRRSALTEFWTTQNSSVVGLTTVGSAPFAVKSDGVDVWAAGSGDATVSRVRGSDGKLLETWTGATGGSGVLVAMGRVFVSGLTSPGKLYRIDPSQPAGAVTTVASNLGITPASIAFDGSRVWTANNGSSVSIVTPGATIPWTVTTVAAGTLAGILYDGANIWVTDTTLGTLLKLDAAGAVLQTVTVGGNPQVPGFDGANIWVPSQGTNTVTVVRASSGVVIQTLNSNGLNAPAAVAFDGQRALVTNYGIGSVSIWKATDLTPVNTFAVGAATNPYGACSDGVNFWIALSNSGKIARF
jgi:hypothetical protein